jgi:Cu-Zn family superoxide dismutase
MQKILSSRFLSVMLGIIVTANFIIVGCSKNERTSTTTKKDSSGTTTNQTRTDTGTMDKDHTTTMSDTMSTAGMKLTCILTGTKESKIKGTLTFTQDGKKVKVTGTIDGLTPGEHGIHVHEKGDCSEPDFTSAGDHFNPNKGTHGDIDKMESHMGDMGNIKADKNGHAELDETTTYINLNQILGKAVVVHANEDDLKTQPSGNSGPRIACGKIEKAK